MNDLLILALPSLKNSTRLFHKKQRKMEPPTLLPRMTKMNILSPHKKGSWEKVRKWLTCKVLTVKQIPPIITAQTIGDVWSICVLIFEFKGLKRPSNLFIPLSYAPGQTYVKREINIPSPCTFQRCLEDQCMIYLVLEYYWFRRKVTLINIYYLR